ncbi:unnamed protein product [Ceutorhynchus assimilis]|uniref:Putative inorganic phosphate cotransporter n=1 Tax=Ceutorhynchus assimilis TaxID=467358 RepID=A0A9P0DCF4_9CUCU|nr:unnamed protein product [Ceutorhynchus assimilis]
MKQVKEGKITAELLEGFLKNKICVEPAPKIGYRHLQVFLYFLLCFIGFGFRVILSVAIVAMTDPNTNPNPNIPTYPEWHDKNVILSAFFWGYMLPQVFAGWAARRFGAKWFLVTTFAVNSVAGFLTPMAAAQFGSKGVMLIRVAQGLTQGFMYPSVTHLMSQWVPVEERSRLSTIVYAAGSAGTIVAMFVSGLISASPYGWPMVFYLYGGLGIIWCVLMALLGHDSPSIHPYISKAEQFYIERSLMHNMDKGNHPTPWKAILTSSKVWALLLAMIGNNYTWWTLLTQIPSYMNSVMHFDIKNNSLLSSLPYLTLWILSFGVGFSSDYIINKGLLERTTSRKVFNSFGMYLPAIALVILGYTRSDEPIRGVALLIAAVSTNAFHFAGFSPNSMDLSPNHAGAIMGLGGLSQFTGVIAPLVVQAVVTDPTNPVHWRYVFFISAGLCVITATIFNIFATAKEQTWNNEEEKQDLENYLKKI